MKKSIIEVLFYIVIIGIFCFGGYLLTKSSHNKDIKPIPISTDNKNTNANNTNTTYFKISFGSYGDSAYIIVTDDINKAYSFIYNNSDSTIDIKDLQSSSGVTVANGYGLPTIWLRDTSLTAESIGVINHEIFHLTYYIMHRAGIPLSDDTDEAYAYELDYISSQIYKHIIYDTK